jgi:uncharacterized peroxidase-related enzyme
MTTTASRPSPESNPASTPNSALTSTLMATPQTMSTVDNPQAVFDRFPVVANLESLPEDLRERILAVQEKAGFVPNVFLKLARRPAEFRAFFAYHDALMDRPGGLSKGERELIVVATSAAADCLYCVVAHGALLRIFEKQPTLADSVAINWRKADLSPRQRAIVEFALKVSLDSAEIGAADFALLQPHGLSDEDAWDIASIAGFFALSNRLANALGIAPNPEFFMMGRVPRAKP